MNAKDWIEFAKEKPKVHQKVLVEGVVCNGPWVGCWNGGRPAWTEESLHWQPWADPPKPDPFEECYGDEWPDDPHRKAIAREFWNAALEWRRQNPE